MAEITMVLANWLGSKASDTGGDSAGDDGLLQFTNIGKAAMRPNLRPWAGLPSLLALMRKGARVARTAGSDGLPRLHRIMSQRTKS